jgi:hypothetical protein
MKDLYDHNEEIIRSETEHDLEVVRKNRLRIDTEAHNNRNYLLMQGEKRKSERTQEIRATI